MDNYRNALAEVYVILDYLDEEDYEKIPEDYIEFLEENMNNEYNYEMNDNGNIMKQKMLPETKAILFNLFRDYISNPEQKEKIMNMQKVKRQKIENEKREKYNPDKIFENKVSKDSSHNNTSLIEVRKETNFIQKLIEKLKLLFKR